MKKFEQRSGFMRKARKVSLPVAAIAIFTGRDGNKMPATYEDRFLWMRARYEYKTLNILDYPDEELLNSKNPFAVVMLVAKEALLQKEGTDEQKDNVLLEQKLMIAKQLKERLAVFGKRKTETVLKFLNNYVVFRNLETNRKFGEETDRIFKKVRTMGMDEAILEIGRREGLEEGLKEGKEESVRLFLANTRFSPEKIAELVGVSITKVMRIKKQLKKK